MKKILLLLALVLGCASAQAQVFEVYKNGELLTTYTNNNVATYKVVVKEQPSHVMVDLGLSVKWASCNIGAKTATDAGDYFAWGETAAKSYYAWTTYKYGTTSTALDKYNFNDGKTILDAEDDAATMLWGSDYRIPTKAEWDELKANCDFTWDDTNKGYTAKSKINNNIVFFPAAGIYDGNAAQYVGETGYYRSSTLVAASSDNYAGGFSFASSQWFINEQTNFPLDLGCPVRPVSAK